MAKITKATFKSFVSKNKDNLFIKNKSTFDPMTDGTMQLAGGFTPVKATERPYENNLGIAGVWLVNSSRNYFNAYEDEQFTGIEVYNCCGNFIVGVKK